MESLLTTLIAALLAEWGDKTQLLVIAFAVRYRAPLPVLAGVAVGALANMSLAAAGGALLHDVVALRLLSLFVAFAFLLAGLGGFFRAKTPDMGATWRVGPFVTTAACFFLLEFGDKTQFITAALAAQYEAAALAAIGATLGVVAANTPAAFLGDRLAAVVPLRGIRIGVAILFLIVAFILGVGALRLV